MGGNNMRCMACYKEFPEGAEVCPRCNFTNYDTIGDDAAPALKALAAKHRELFLKKTDLGVMVYTWKDQNGTIVLDQKKRLSFGTVDTLAGKTVWLSQKFSRLPDTGSMTVDLSIERQGIPGRILPVAISLPQERQLQQLGVSVSEELMLTLMLKNDTTTKTSRPVDFL